jgi:hypothetical protein
VAEEDPWAVVRKAINEACEEKEDAPVEREGSGWKGRVIGFCPVQGEGTVDGLTWYFRARHDAWSFDVWREPMQPSGDLPTTEPIWSANAPYDDGDGDASWMPYSHAWQYIEACIATGRDTNWAMPSPRTPDEKSNG